jgi:hypothetical protein
MSKTTFGFVTAAAILASVTAFAQDQAPAPSSDSAAPPAAASDSSAPAEKPMHKHHHMMKGGAKSASTDHDADKLNACMADAMPTDAQAQCLKQASS